LQVVFSGAFDDNKTLFIHKLSILSLLKAKINTMMTTEFVRDQQREKDNLETKQELLDE